MKPPKSATRKTGFFAKAAAASALIWAVSGLLWAQVIVLPTPILLPPTSLAEALGRIPATPRPDRFVVMLFKETSLLLAAFALLGLALCALAARAGARKSSIVAAAACAAVLAVSLVPVVQATKTASTEGVPLSLSRYVSDLSPVPERFADRTPETVIYARSGGEVLKADVWEPRGETEGSGRPSGPDDPARGRPAVIVVHGGGWRSGERSDFPSWDAWLAEEGYVVFDIDYSLAPPPTWREAPSDVACAVGWVKENSAHYGVDPRRVALMGRSAGSQLALLTAYEGGRASPAPGCTAREAHDTGVAAVAAFYAPSDLSRLAHEGYLPGMDGFVGGSMGAVPGRYRNLSPVSHLDPSDPPTFLAYGGDDQTVPPGQSELLGERLRGAGVAHRLVELPWANHTFDFLWGGWSAQITRSTLREFLKANL
jgi:acetyl esterase/lipase